MFIFSTHQKFGGEGEDRDTQEFLRTTVQTGCSAMLGRSLDITMLGWFGLFGPSVSFPFRRGRFPLMVSFDVIPLRHRPQPAHVKTDGVATNECNSTSERTRTTIGLLWHRVVNL